MQDNALSQWKSPLMDEAICQYPIKLDSFMSLAVRKKDQRRRKVSLEVKSFLEVEVSSRREKREIIGLLAGRKMCE